MLKTEKKDEIIIRWANETNTYFKNRNTHILRFTVENLLFLYALF